MRLLKNRVLVRPKLVEDKTESGFIIPEQAKKAPSSGEVLAVGSTAIVTVGDYVIYEDGAGTDVDHDDEWLLIMSDADIKAVI